MKKPSSVKAEHSLTTVNDAAAWESQVSPAVWNQVYDVESLWRGEGVTVALAT